MAHYSVHVGEVRRSVGQNAIESAAYISRSKLTLHQVDKEYNIPVSFTYDYSKKGGLEFSKIYAPEHAPEWVFDRQQLWNKAELAENRCDAIPAGKIMVALPNEFSAEQNIELVEKIAAKLVKLGMIVDANIHYDSEGNPHSHFQHTVREFVKNIYGEYDFSPFKNRDWRGPEWTKFIREMTADMINESYLEHGFAERVTHKSYKELGIDLTPSVHEGPARNMHNAELTELNRQIAVENAEKIKEKPSIILDVLALNRPVFTKEQIAKELEKRLYAGIDFNKIENVESMQKELSETFTTLYESILAGPELAQVVEADFKGNALYTTTKRLELEERFEDNIKALHARTGHALNIQDSDLDHLSWGKKVAVKIRDVKSEIIEKINDKTGLVLEKPKQEVTLSEEQRKAIVNVLNGSDISVLEGIPGAGKTTVMKEIVRQYEKAGYRVIGAAPSSAASLELAKSTGIECKNISQWRKVWTEERGKKFDLMLKGDYYKEDLYKDLGMGLSRKHVVIIDEASMGELANMDYFASEARAAGAKILKVGDRNQISPVGWAGALDKTISICGSQRLHESRRQQKESHQQATKLLAQYRVREALDIYWREGCIKVANSKAEANSMLVNSFVNSYIETSKSLERDDLISTHTKAIGVYENKTRRLLNENVRRQLKEAGILKGEEHRVLVGAEMIEGKREPQYLNLCRGEQIIFAKNANSIGKNGIFNGELGTILEVHKPNKDALAKLDILMHRADGSKEKVRLDLAELATNKHTGKYFFDKTQIEYGYAVTGHKVQGGTKLETEILLEKNTGFNIFNVLATRHKEDVKFIIDRETIYDAFYESMDETAAKARNRYEFGKDDDEAILKSGLAKLVSKRVNTSFASEYHTLGLTEEDKYIKEYLDKAEDTIAIVRKIEAWQTLEKRKTGDKPPMWHHEDWQEFKDARVARAKAASTMIAGFAPTGERAEDARVGYQDLTNAEYYSQCKQASYEKFRNRLMQTGINYITLEKHASQILNKDSQLDRVQWQEKESVLFGQAEFKDLVDAVASGNSSRCKRSYLLIESNIADRELAIEQKKEEQNSLEAARQEFIDAIGKWKHFREKLTPEYLNRIYKADSNTNNSDTAAGQEAIKNYEAIIAEHGIDKAVSMVVKNPKLLGDLKGYGVGKLFGLNDDRKDAIALCKNLGRQLQGYNRSGAMVAEFEAKMQEADFGKRLYELSEEIENLRSLLPEGIDKKFLNEVNLKLQSSKNNNIDWRDLQKSELFDAIRAEMYMPKEAKMFDIYDALQVNLDQDRVIEPKSVEQKSNFEKESTFNEVLKNSLQENSKEVNGSATTSNSNYQYKPSKPQLTFAEVKAGLSQSVITDIFHRYGPVINPDAKIEKRGDQLKLGSLYMSTSGSKAGLWNRFSQDGSKGDIFKFVEESTGCSKYEALEIVASHAGVIAQDRNASVHQDITTLNNQEVATQEQNNIKNLNREKNENWVANSIVPDSAPKFNAENDLSFLTKQGNIITDTYEYRNIDNELLGYTVRIEEKASGKKQVLPVVYCHNEAKGLSRWQLKGISDNRTKPIYKLEQLTINPEKPILIVEGEKTANKAQELLPDYNVISWIGGAQAVDKVNWSKLTEKVVSIWPDNDKPGIVAASRIANHLDCHNGFSGLVSIVDTEKLGLPEKWDLADKIPEGSKLANIGIVGAIEEARVNNRTISNRLETSQELFNSFRKGTGVLGSIEMLVETGHLSKDNYISKTIYSNTINVIAHSKGIDLGNLEDHSEFIKAVNDASYEYHELQRSYGQKQLQGQEKSQLSQLSPLGIKVTKDQLLSDIVRDISILHQVQLGVRELPRVHVEHIESAANQRLKNVNVMRLNDSDKEAVANNVYKVVSGKEWTEELNAKNQQLAHSISIKYTAKTIDEFLNNDHAKSDLANIRKIGVDEKDIFASFKEDYSKGLEALKEMSDKVTMASGFAADNREILVEAARFGYGADYSATVRSLVGMNEQEAITTCMKINDNSLQEYFAKNLSELQCEKRNTFLFEELKPLIYAEQEFLKETYQTINKPINSYGVKNRDYLESGKAFLENPEIVSNTFKLAEKLVEQTGRSEPEIARYMNSGRGNINYLHGFLSKQLEHHACYTKPNMLLQERQKSKDIETAFKVIEKEQNIYAGMHGNISHHLFDKKLLEKAETAFVQKENNELDKLKDIAQISLDTGAKSQDSLLEDLQNTGDLKKSQEKIKGSIENHELAQTLNGFELQKEKCKNPIEILTVLQERQNYLCNNELKYPEYIEKEHLQVINQNQMEKQEGRLDNLGKVVEFLASEKLHTDIEILSHLKNSNNIKESEALLIQSYHAKYITDIEKNLNIIAKEGQLNTNGRVFDSPEKYLDFKANSLNKVYTPQEALEQKQEQIKESQNQKEAIEISRNFGDFER